MGSAVLSHLAQRGDRALGLERFEPAHAMGSSHGGSRIIRKTLMQGVGYVPLVMRAYELWDRLERNTGATLIKKTGGLVIGPRESPIVENSRASALEHGLAHEMLDTVELRRRYTEMRFRDEEIALYEPDAAILYPERCVLAHQREAMAHGAEARFGVRVSDWESLGSSVRVRTSSGETIEGQRLIITAGAWFSKVMPTLGIPLKIERNIMHWFASPDTHTKALELLPVYIVQRDGEIIYGFPSLPGEGLKIAFNNSRQYVDPDSVTRAVPPSEADGIRAVAKEFIPFADRYLASKACLYTNTPDEHFVIGLHPEHSNVVIAGGFSGHGFKFCSVIGEILADLAIEGSTRHDLSLFDPTRFRNVTSTAS